MALVCVRLAGDGARLLAGLAWPQAPKVKSTQKKEKKKEKKKDPGFFNFSFFHFFVFSPLGQSGDEKNEKMKKWKIGKSRILRFFFSEWIWLWGPGARPAQPEARPAQPGARPAQPGASPAGRCPANQSAGRQVGWPAQLVGVGFPENSLEFPLGL